MSLDLSPGSQCVADGMVVEIDGPDSLSHMRVRNVITNESLLVRISHIEPLPDSKKTTVAGYIPEREWKRCVGLAKDLKDLNHRPRVPKKELTKIATRHSISVRQLQRARAVFVNDPRVSALARKSAGRPIGLNCLDPQVDSLILHVIRKYYFQKERPCKEQLVARIQSIARRTKLSEPSRNAVLLRIKREEGYEADLARLGGKAAGQKWDPRTGRLVVNRPLELIQIDHTPADIIVLSDDRMKVLGRPWVTVAIDVCTRCVVGLYVSMDAPSAVSIALCIEHAVLPKGENEDDSCLWPMYGKPERILVDNGKDFRSLALQRGCQEHGIELRWRPVRTPHYGAHIERLIGTLMKLTHLLPGTTFSNIRERGNYPSASKARMTLDEYQAWLTQKICRFYHVRRHRGIGLPPMVAWDRGFIRADGTRTTPSLMQRPLDFRMDFLPFKLRSIDRGGIRLNASRYWHDDLTPLLNLPELTPVSFHPRHPAKVWVRRPDGLLVTAPAIAGRAMGEPDTRREIDDETARRLQDAEDMGFEATDLIEAVAERTTKAARRKGAQLKKAAATRTDDDAIGTYVVDMPRPGSRPIPVEEWE